MVRPRLSAISLKGWGGHVPGGSKGGSLTTSGTCQVPPRSLRVFTNKLRITNKRLGTDGWNLASCTPRFYRRMWLPWHSEVSGTCVKSGITQTVKPKLTRPRNHHQKINGRPEQSYGLAGCDLPQGAGALLALSQDPLCDRALGHTNL